MPAIIFIKNVNVAQKYSFKLIWENKTVSIKKCSYSVSFNGSCVLLIIILFSPEKKTLQGKY